MQVSEVEQELACGGHNFAVHFNRVVDVIEDVKTKPSGRLRLALLFVLRYEKELRDDAGQKLGQLKDLLFKFGCGRTPSNAQYAVQLTSVLICMMSFTELMRTR